MGVDNIKKTLREKSDLLDDSVKRFEIMASVQHEIKNSIDYPENQSCRNNLQIDGVAKDNCFVQVTNFFAQHPGNPNQRCTHRAIAQNDRKHPPTPKTIVLKFESCKDREMVTHTDRKQKPRGLFFNQDVCNRQEGNASQTMRGEREWQDCLLLE